ncbi:hypothetical protein LA345_39235 (plasmid) [Burkholderia vietnamiensis]|uniref:Uncharacterized protein n=1 Tax=Burkholderia vietnamiensis (strain G4 / LMG 22486) TaxID=269482 RepID=A4JW93_BURVG|nr:hypothetical protein Bcep1808_7676 [Burkholderia vietnamiensis G4]MCB4349835.1 hypothetical protein [Burkholderia vietnamiensis]
MTTDKSRADALTGDKRQALGEALTEYFAELDRDIGIDTPDRILSLIDYHDERFIYDLIDRVIVPTIAASPVEQHEAAPAGIEPPRHIIDAAMDVARDQYGHGVTRASIVAIWKALGRPWAAPLEGTGNGADERAACEKAYQATASNRRTDELSFEAGWECAVEWAHARAPRTEVAGAVPNPTGDQLRAAVRSVGSLGTNHADAPHEYVLAGWRAAMRAAAPSADAAAASQPVSCKCRRLGDWDGAHHPLCDGAAPHPAAAAGQEAVEPVATGHGLSGIPRAAFGPHTEADRIDHCGACGAENAPQKDDVCPTCGATCSLVSTWGGFQHERYRNGQRYANNGPQWWEDGPQPAAPTTATSPSAEG